MNLRSHRTERQFSVKPWTIRSIAVFAGQQKLSHLGDEITALTAHLDTGEYRFLALVEAFDRDQRWSGTGINSCAHWLNHRCGISIGVARKKVRVARALPALPQIGQAFRTGRVSYSKVQAMTRVATAYLAASETGGSSADRYIVNLHTDIETLQANGIGAEAELEAGSHGSRGNVHCIHEANRRKGLEITAKTTVPRWYGEKMDGSLAVLALIQRE